MPKNYLTVISTYFKTYVKQIAIVIFALVAFQGWRAYQNYLKTQQTSLQQENEINKKKISDLTTEYNKLAAAKKEAEAANAKLATDADFWRKKAQETPIPPPVPRPPVDDITLVSDLKAAGVEFVPLQGTLFSTDRVSLPVIWVWNKESIRVPGLEAKIANDEVALTKSDALIVGLNNQILISDKMISDADQREAVRKLQEVNLNQQLKVKDKQILVAETNGWLRIAVAVPATWFIAKQVYKK